MKISKKRLKELADIAQNCFPYSVKEYFREGELKEIYALWDSSPEVLDGNHNLHDALKVLAA